VTRAVNFFRADGMSPDAALAAAEAPSAEQGDDLRAAGLSLPFTVSPEQLLHLCLTMSAEEAAAQLKCSVNSVRHRVQGSWPFKLLTPEERRVFLGLSLGPDVDFEQLWAQLTAFVTARQEKLGRRAQDVARYMAAEAHHAARMAEQAAQETPSDVQYCAFEGGCAAWCHGRHGCPWEAHRLCMRHYCQKSDARRAAGMTAAAATSSQRTRSMRKRT
jgi:hypothetical protein